ncbi:unnamed protein product [Parnassius mnemosyne]|uniref:PiggyBac transposable element-derived protein domain-containing protein n=1 Tax=Parnassius mnemosyne TaxID=213953 RepID=A0AAV1L2Q0_9NEOP
MASKRLSNYQILECILEDDEESIIDSPDEDEGDDEVIQSDHNSESEESANETELEWSDDDNEPLSRHASKDSDSFYLSKKKCTKWAKEPPRTSVRVRRHNIMRETPGPKGAAKEIHTMSEAFFCMFSMDTVNLVLQQTNDYIKSIQGKFQRERDCKFLEYEELLAYLGLLYMSGVLRSSHLNFKDLWATDGTGIEFFQNTMSFNRFLFISRCVRFDDKNTRSERQKTDKLAAVREFTDLMNNNFINNYSASENVTLDEQLPAFRGRFSGVVYMPNKPTKYGIKHYALVDSATFYLLKFEIYAGVQPEGPYRMPNDTVSLVKRMTEPIWGTGRNVTMDNWFTSVPLTNTLLKDRQLTMVGTIRKNKPEIPTCFQPKRTRAEHSSLFGFQEDVTLCSYVPKKSKAVLLISSMHHDNKIVESEKKKPEIILYYNRTKGGVDTNDQMCANYNVGRRTKRWPMVIFYHLLNVAGINAYVIYKNKIDHGISRREFLKHLAVDLGKARQQTRATIPQLPRAVQKRLKRNAQVQDPSPTSRGGPSTTYKRCHICPRSKDKKIRFMCAKCHQQVCHDHSTMICDKCID